MRVGTWNLEGRWSREHRELLDELHCATWLLTEVPQELSLPGHTIVRSATAPTGTSWSAIGSSTPVTAIPAAHPASAAVMTASHRVVASVLPWPLVADETFPGTTRVQRMELVLSALVKVLDQGPVVWGGDWNVPLSGDLRGFDRATQQVVSAVVRQAGLQVPTAELAGGSAGQRSIDHVAVPVAWSVHEAGVRPVPRALSDHPAYWVNVSP